MTGNVEEAYQARTVETLFDSARDGETHLFELTREISVQDGQFFRVEVFSESSLYGDFDAMGGFAFTNPIWVGELIEAKYEDNVTVIERKLTLNKTTFEQGEDILITPMANPKTDTLAVYPVDFVPGQDASIYWARFEGYPGATATVAAGSTFKLTDLPGDNRGNWQVGHMYDILPAGEYKAVIRGADGSVVLQVNFTVEEP